MAKLDAVDRGPCAGYAPSVASTEPATPALRDAPARRTADGIFSGGGIKGLAFAGALAASEQAGYGNWHELAGTSAGAITAMALAAGYDAAALQSSLDAFDFASLADYGSPIHLLGAIRDLVLHESLVEGDALGAWIRGLLERSPSGVGPDVTFAELQRLTGRTLVVVGTDLAHGRVVAFPQDLALYHDGEGKQLGADSFPVHKAVRISAGYPYFFPPVGGLFDNATKQEGVFVDGGVGSAFPLYIFDKPQPEHPTWGYHLHDGMNASETVPSHRDIGGIEWPKQMLEAILETAMNALDKFEQRRFEGRVIAIPTGAVPTLEFNLSDAQKKELYDAGFKAAGDFFANPPKPPENSYGRIP
jgi:NTE family protein